MAAVNERPGSLWTIIIVLKANNFKMPPGSSHFILMNALLKVI